MRQRDQDPGEVEIGSDHVTIRRPHEQRRITARILHRENSADGAPVWLVLDRLVHDYTMDRLGTWGTSGAVTTELRATA